MYSQPTEQPNDPRHSTGAWDTKNQPTDAGYQEFKAEDVQPLPIAGHQWIQMGTELKCTSCPFGHGTFIDPDYQLYGIDDEGKPMLRKVEVH